MVGLGRLSEVLKLLLTCDYRQAGNKAKERSHIHWTYTNDIVNSSVKCGVYICARNVDNLQAVDTASYCVHVDIIRFVFGHLTSIDCFNRLEDFRRFALN